MPLLPPMSVFPPKKRPKVDKVEDPDGDIVLWDSRKKRWLRVRGGGNAKIMAVVTKAIKCASNATATPSNANFRDAMGEARIEGSGKIVKVACRDLAGKNDAYPEQIPAGTTVQLIEGGQYDNPDYDPGKPEDADNPKKIDWYVAIETEGVYTGILASKLILDRSSTIQIKDCYDELITLTVHAYYLDQYQYIEYGTGVMVARQATDSGLRLVVVKSRSVINPDTT